MAGSRLAKDQQPNDTDPNSRSRGIGIDMSPAAILERPKIKSDLSRTCQALGQAKLLGKSLELDRAGTGSE
jgi:hypothetical protein